jgi:hypothetical protein
MLGGGHYRRFMPYPNYLKDKVLPVPVIYQMECFCCNWQCAYTLSNEDKYPCIEKITVENTWGIVSQLLSDNIINKEPH